MAEFGKLTFVFLAKSPSGPLDIVKNMDLLQNQEKQFYEDQLSSRKSQISDVGDKNMNDREKKIQC